MAKFVPVSGKCGYNLARVKTHKTAISAWEDNVRIRPARLIGWLLGFLIGVVLAWLLSSCGGTAPPNEVRLPPLRPTVTPVPPTTPTPIPQAKVFDVPAVDWGDVSAFRAAMRPAFADDVLQFVDANRYYVVAELSIEGNVALIRGAERVRYTNHSQDTLDEIVFRLYPNFTALGGTMVVHSVELEGEPIQPILRARDTVLSVPLTQPLAPGQSAEMVLQFTTTAERGMNASYSMFGYHRDVISASEWHPLLSVYEEGAGWWEVRPPTNGDSLYHEDSLFETTLTMPQEYVPIFSGSELETRDNGDGTKTVHYVSGPMRTSKLIAGKDYGVLSGQVEDIAVNIYYRPGGESAAEPALQFALDTVRVNNRSFGEYPYAELDVVETFVYTGMEHPGLVTASERWWERGNPLLETVIVHEIGHQWFYSLVGNDQVGHPWIDESLTVYTEYNYTLEVHGEKKAREWVQNYYDRYNAYRGRGGPDLPLNLSTSAYTDANYGVIIYVKGPLFYIELEKKLGRETFLKALQLYVARHRYGIAHSRDILEAFEEVSGQDLDAFFYEWVGWFDGLDPSVAEHAQTITQ